MRVFSGCNVKLKFRKSFPQRVLYELGVSFCLNHAEEIIGIANQIAFAMPLWPDDKSRTTDPTHSAGICWKASDLDYRPAVFPDQCRTICSSSTYPAFKNLLDQQEKAWVFNADLQKRQHPVMRNVIKEAFDVCLNQHS